MNFIKIFLAGLLAVIVGSFLVLFIWIFILMGIAGSMERSVAVEQSSILKIDLSETLTDAPSSDPFAGLNPVTLQVTHQLSLFKALKAIEAAAIDDRIKGIYIRFSNMTSQTESAVTEELREAISDFKQSGKFVVAYNDVYTQGQYYLASVADKVYLQPEGMIDWSGLSFDLMFYKGLFDKLDLSVDVFRPTACKYKSAVEPFILDKMSDANREQMQELTNSMWGTISSAVCQSRGIDSLAMQQLTDSLAAMFPQDALKRGLVDELIYEDQMNDVFAKLGVEANKEGDYRFISLGEYAATVSADVKNISADQVAVVYAAGAIVDGEGVGEDIYGNTLAAKLRDVRKDTKIKSVVLRVNSPGGSALASDVVWREMELLKAEKPVIVSMGSYAASGGYYIACPADVIVADKLTLTGSIGVFGLYVNTFDALKNKLGITFDAVRSNTSAGMGMSSPLTAAQRAVILRGVDKVYTSFTTKVAEGRNLPLEKVLDIAGGRVWSGEDALGIGLIDTYGGLKTAIAIAVDKASLGDKYRVVEVLDAPSGLAMILSSLNAQVRAAFTRSELGVMMKEYEQVREAVSQRGVVMYSPYKIELE